MNSDNDNLDPSFIAKRVKPRYINITEDIYLALSGDALKIYIALRFESDYNKDCSSVEKNIKYLCNTARVKRNSCFECLNELENFGLLRRESKAGSQSTYWISSDLNYFNQQNTEPVRVADGLVEPVRVADDPVRVADTITTNSFTNKNSITKGIEENLYIESEQQRKAMFFREECLSSEKCKDLYEQLPEDTKKDKSFEDIYTECLSHYATKQYPQLVSVQRLMSWIKRGIAFCKNDTLNKPKDSYSTKPNGTNNFYDALKSAQSGVTYDH